MSERNPLPDLPKRKPVTNANMYEVVPQTSKFHYERSRTKDQGKTFGRVKKAWPFTALIVFCDVILTLVPVAFIGKYHRILVARLVLTYL